jgi:hypothetical protein
MKEKNVEFLFEKLNKNNLENRGEKPRKFKKTATLMK